MLEQIVDIISKQLKTEPEEITPETNITEDLGADSLDIVELLMSIEEAFGVSVPDEDVQGLKTIKDIVDYVESKK
ncbi:MAG: acyl carrier protein [Oscillospiraceae bacterium]|nr:acyl carrier protein [Oscillospiraceae bacterium]